MGWLQRLFGGSASTRKVPGDPREVFRGEILGRLRNRGVTNVVVTPDAYGVQYQGPSGQTHRVYLDNLFAETREVTPEQRELMIERVLSIGGAVEKPPSWEEARARVRVTLRASFGLPPGEPAARLVMRPFAPALFEVLVVDSAESLATASLRDLEAWGVSEEEAFVAGRRNLQALAADGVELYEREPAPIWHVNAGDDYESARLLLPGFLASFSDRVSGRPIAIVPHRGELVIAGDGHPAVVERLVETAEREFAAASRSISAALYTVDAAGAVVPYLPAGSDPLSIRIRNLHRQFVGGEYTHQKSILEAHFEKRGEDLFVASFSGLKREGGELLTYAVWPLGIDTLLPQTDVVAFSPSEDKSQTRYVRWEQLQAIAGKYLTASTDLMPVRWRTATEVPQTVVAALLAAGVTSAEV